MALDSNSPGDDRSGAGAAERIAATGLKLVGASGGQAIGGAASASGQAPASEAKGPSGSTPVRRGDRKQGRRLPLWAFGVLVALFVIGYGYQTHHASRLEAEVARLEASLVKAEARLESHRTHLLEIRTGVHDLSARLESLRVLIDRDPTAEPQKKPEPSVQAAPRPNTP
jgi:hypothetical protein